MFFNNRNTEEIKRYELLLKIMGALSNLSSDNKIPFLYYRMAENIFCKAFNAINLARSDISLDAKKNNIGIGLKTFINKQSGSIEKIAEFNRNKHLIDGVPLLKNKIKLISTLRNERLEATSGITDVAISNMFYHCILREKDKFIIHEDKMLPVSLSEISKIKENGNNTITFYDDNNEYTFNFSKSTLFKRFTPNPIHEIPIKIFDDPYSILEKYLTELLNNQNLTSNNETNKEIEKIYLPLYSFSQRKGFYVPEKSGLNQWNANGRSRNIDEVYIRIPAIIHKKFPSFFPNQDTSFSLKLPNGSYLITKICQENGKALMSNPNSALGKWILRSVLRLNEGEIATYSKLEQIGIDTVEISKYTDETYEINFKKLGTYADFETNILNNINN